MSVLHQKLQWVALLYLKKIKSFTGQSTTEFIRSIRLKKAAQLIKTGKYSITEVIFMVGFSDSKYFRTCFKKQYKLTPSGYLNSLKKGEYLN